MSMQAVRPHRVEADGEERLARQPGDPLPVRQAALVWLAAAAFGWLSTVGLVWAITQAF